MVWMDVDAAATCGILTGLLAEPSLHMRQGYAAPYHAYLLMYYIRITIHSNGH